MISDHVIISDTIHKDDLISGRTHPLLDWKMLQVHPISQGLALWVIWLAEGEKTTRVIGCFCVRLKTEWLRWQTNKPFTAIIQQHS